MTTNYERIKNMSLDEMQQMLYYMATGFDVCGACPIRRKCDRYEKRENIPCKEVWKQWLNKEVDSTWEYWVDDSE